MNPSTVNPVKIWDANDTYTLGDIVYQDDGLYIKNTHGWDSMASPIEPPKSEEEYTLDAIRNITNDYHKKKGLPDYDKMVEMLTLQTILEQVLELLQ